MREWVRHMNAEAPAPERVRVDGHAAKTAGGVFARRRRQARWRGLACAASRRPALDRRLSVLSDTDQWPGQRPRQLALALGFRESFARDDFLPGPSTRPPSASSKAGRTGRPGRWRWSGRRLGQSHLAAIWAKAAGARFDRRPRDRAGRRPHGGRHRRARDRGPARGRLRGIRAVPSAQSGARGGRLRADHGAHGARRMDHRVARPRLAPARLRPSPWRRPTTRCCAPS